MTKRDAGSDSGSWLTPNLWKIAGSAFFADFGYQAVLAGFPLFLVLILRAPVWSYGVAMALSYGPGALAAYWGGRWGDRWDHQKLAILGNLLIPVLSLAGLAVLPWQAVALFVVGWLARNLRSPSRRVMVTRSVKAVYHNQAFGFLHALDVGGGMLSALGLLVLLAIHTPFRGIFLLTIVPLLLSTGLLAGVKPAQYLELPAPKPQTAAERRSDNRTVRGVLVASALYGFSSYSMGFPILTVAEGTRDNLWGVLSYVIFLGVSALTGYVLGRRLQGSVKELAGFGYFAAAIGSAGLAVAYAVHASPFGYFLPVAVLGFALGSIETLEPTIIARHGAAASSGRRMGSLTMARSVGLFLANLVMGLLYHLTPVDAYAYATVVALAAVLVLLVVLRPGPERPASAAGPATTV